MIEIMKVFQLGYVHTIPQLLRSCQGEIRQATWHQKATKPRNVKS